jgi:translation initiation factor IF-1
MSHPEQIEARAILVEILDHGAYRAELANGHTCIVRPASKSPETYAVGSTVVLAFHPADLSRARIISPSSG